jgi:uncharacterized protein (DUF58 family)
MNNQKDSETRIMSYVAVLIGFGLVSLDLTTGLLATKVDPMVRWMMYVPLCLLSIWGLTQILMEFLPSAIGQRLTQRNNRRTFHLPKEGRFFLVMMIMIFLAAMLGRSNMLILIFSAMVGPFVINGWMTYSMLKNLKVQRTLPEMVMAGSTFSVELILANTRMIIPSFLLSIKDHVQSKEESLNPEVLFVRVPPRQSRQTPYHLCLMHRGMYEFGPLDLTTRFPLGFVERGLIVELREKVIVHPRIGHLSPYWKKEIQRNQQSQQMVRRHSGSLDDDFHHIREYRIGDDPRAIHWRTTARTNELMIKEFRQSKDRDMVILLDLWTSPRPTPEEKALVEHTVSLATTIALDQVRSSGDQSLQIYAEGQKSSRWLVSDGQHGMTSILKFFALLESGTAAQSPQMLQSAAVHRYHHNRIILISTRPELNAGFANTNLAQPYRDLALTVDALQVLDPRPEITGSYFQLD